MNVDLSSNYLGFTLRNPIVASAGPTTGKPEGLRRLAEADIAAVVLPSLFEEQITQEEIEIAKVYDYGTETNPEASSYLPDVGDYKIGPRSYLELIEQAKSILSVPVIGSLNGTSKGGWIEYARMIQDAGADALELNIYFLATDPDTTGAEVEQRYLDLVAAVRAEVSIPLAVKVGPYFSSTANMGRKLVEAGADGLVLFNRFLQPDINMETLEVGPHLVLSTSEELRLPLRWIAILSSFLERTSLAATSGVHTAEDVLKVLLAGADVAMMTSALLQNGPFSVCRLLDDVRGWMVENEYTSVEQLKGSLSQKNSPDPAAFERSNYVKTITSYSGVPW